MSSREILVEPDAICDYCGAKGAFDFMGDYVCPECALKMFEDMEEYEKEKKRKP